MENLNKISKSILFLTIASFVLYTGSHLTKLVLIGQFFDAETMQLKQLFSNQNLSITLKTLLPAFSVTLISFACFVLFFICFILLARISFRKYGWLFIISIALLITTPFEIYLVLKYDWEIINALLSNSFNQEYIIELLKGRITKFGPFPLVLLFSNILIILLATFKPLQKIDEN